MEDAHLTQASIDLPWYPISLSAISAKVAEKIMAGGNNPEHHAHATGRVMFEKS